MGGGRGREREREREGEREGGRERGREGEGERGRGRERGGEGERKRERERERERERGREMGSLSWGLVVAGSTHPAVHTNTYRFVLAEEAGAPATLAAGTRVHPHPAGQDLVAGGGVSAVRELRIPCHVAVNHIRDVLEGGGGRGEGRV